MRTSLIIYQPENDPMVRVLQELIAKRKRLLQEKTQQVETLKKLLFEIEQEYGRRIGQIHRKEHIIDLYLDQTRRIINMLTIGLTYQEALSELKEIDDAKRGWANEKKRYSNSSFSEYKLESKEAVELVFEDIKKLWKKLVRKFHPDLADTQDEKKKREKIMKQINNAYAAKDIQALWTIDELELFEEIELNSVVELEKQLEQVENAIIRLEKEFQELKSQQWYDFLKAGKNKREKLFIKMEEEALLDVEKKEKELYALQKQHNLT